MRMVFTITHIVGIKDLAKVIDMAKASGIQKHPYQAVHSKDSELISQEPVKS